jgi:hypothetical protein
MTLNIKSRRELMRFPLFLIARDDVVKEYDDLVKQQWVSVESLKEELNKLDESFEGSDFEKLQMVLGKIQIFKNKLLKQLE